MSITHRDAMLWLHQVSRDRQVGHLAARVAVVLSEHLNRETDEAFPSQERLAAAIGVTPRGVRKALDELVERGHLGVERVGARRVNRYRIAFSTDVQPPPKPQMTGTVVPLMGRDDRNRGSSQDGGERNSRSGRGAVRGTVVPPNLRVSSSSSVDSPESEIQGKGAPKRRRETSLPDNFPGQAEFAHLAQVAQAAGVALDPAAEAAKFRDHHEAKGTAFASWPAGWRTWCRNAVTFAKRDAQRLQAHHRPGHEPFSPLAYAMETLECR